VICDCWSAHRCCAGVTEGLDTLPSTARASLTGAVLRVTTAGDVLAAGVLGGVKTEIPGSGIGDRSPSSAHNRRA
jgi:hypothetical protein